MARTKKLDEKLASLGVTKKNIKRSRSPKATKVMKKVNKRS